MSKDGGTLVVCGFSGNRGRQRLGLTWGPTRASRDVLGLTVEEWLLLRAGELAGHLG